MSILDTYQGGGSLVSSAGGARMARQLGREISRVRGGTELKLARVEAAAEVQAAVVDAVGYVGGKAMQGVALLSQMEQQLAQAVPHASGRLATIADLTAISMAGVVADTARRCGR